MPLHLSWQDIALRLVLTVAAGAVIGFNRERGHAAGLRTTILVCLAASVSMIQVNLLLPTTGKTPDSFVVVDLFRLPLGILSGMGFIGAGAILRRTDLVTGVTTAATLWMATVIGLCLGGGQLWLGIVATGIGTIVLVPLKWIEFHLAHDRHALLIIRYSHERPLEEVVLDTIRQAGYRATLLELSRGQDPPATTLRFEIHWKAAGLRAPPADLLRSLQERQDIGFVDWRCQGRQSDGLAG